MGANLLMSQLSNSSIDLLVILGPTATGKTKLAVQLADKLSGEVISADSRQMYRDMDIGTAKPTPAVLKKYPHALVDIRGPEEIYSAGLFCKESGRLVCTLCCEISTQEFVVLQPTGL